MAFYLGRKISVGTNDLSPKEATQMSHEVKYIGMDVHKEAIVIAVLDGSGKLVMETIVETKASSILQFLHGLRGELHVTWEEGTWAAWLYDLLQPQVPHIVVCNPRRNAYSRKAARATRWMRASWPTCYAPGCCDRSTTEKMDCERCASWRAAIRPSAKI
jgi:hypothetical protein